MDGLDVTPDLIIPEDELDWRFATSGGPGGQHANRSATRVVLRWNPGASTALGVEDRARIMMKLEARMMGESLEVAVDETRSQWRNRQIARSRLADLVREALRPDPPARRPTRPRSGVRKRRLERKRRRGETKRLRRPPTDD